jgi:hypothetical protein
MFDVFRCFVPIRISLRAEASVFALLRRDKSARQGSALRSLAI